MEELKLVTFEQAKKLKEIGFPQDNDIRTPIYDTSGKCNIYYTPGSKPCCVAPSLELAKKWLNKEKDIIVDVRYCSDNIFDSLFMKFHSILYILKKGYIEEVYVKGHWCEYDYALETAIDKALEILNTKQYYNDEV